MFRISAGEKTRSNPNPENVFRPVGNEVLTRDPPNPPHPTTSGGCTSNARHRQDPEPSIFDIRSISPSR